MVTDIETIHQDLLELKKDVAFIKNVLSEDFELSDETKASLIAARKTSESDYIDLG